MKDLVEVIDGFAGGGAEIVFYEGDRSQSLSYDELRHEVAVMASRLRAAGVGAGDRVLVSLQSGRADLVLFLALIYAGAVPLSIKPRASTVGDYGGYICDIAALVSADFSTVDGPVPAGAKPLLELPPSTVPLSRSRQARGDELAFVQFSSGSVTAPKPVALSHRAVLHNIREIVSVDGRGSDSHGLCVLPLCHDMGLIGGVLTNFITRNPLTIVDSSYFLRAPIKVLRYAMEQGVYVTAMPAFILRYLARILSMDIPSAPFFRSYRAIYCGAELIRRDVICKFADAAGRFGFDPASLIFAYGLAEASLIVTYHRVTTIDAAFDQPRDGVFYANNGRAVPGLEFKISGADAGETGAVCIRGRSLFCGYDGTSDYRNEWFETGDLGYTLAGDLYLIGRCLDKIIVDGNNLHCVDIECYLIEAFGLEDCLVGQVSGGGVGILVVTRRVQVELAAVRASLKGNFGVVPEVLEMIRSGQVIRTTSGKVIKGLTLEKFAGGPHGN